MAYETKTVPVSKEQWTLVTSNVALLQFNDEMEMALTSGATPNSTVGLKMDVDEKYVNGQIGVYVWCKGKLGGTNVESVRVAENV